MSDSFNASEYMHYLRLQWRVSAIAAATAVIGAAAITLSMPKRYTAVSSVMIDAPGFSDPRLALGVSAVYLESLKGYERLAAGDTLFAQMAARFHLRDGADSKPIESLKRQILKVEKVRDTRVLEIRVTLKDATLAQQCAEFLAEQTAKLSREESLAADQDLSMGPAGLVERAKERLATARKSQAAELGAESVEALQSEAESAMELLSKSQQALTDAASDVAEYEQRLKLAPSQPGLTEEERGLLKVQLEAAKARESSIQGRAAQLKNEFDVKSRQLSAKAVRSAEIKTEADRAEAAYASALTRLNEMEAANGTRSERLRVIDRGIVPQRPSSPNLGLNVASALVFAILFSAIYTAFGFARYVHSPRRFEPELAMRRP